jgi:hypothetical protein
MKSRKSLDFPPAVAKAFVKDMAVYFVESNPMKRDHIALRQLHALKDLQGSREKPLRLSDVKRMFLHFRNTE